MPRQVEHGVDEKVFANKEWCWCIIIFEDDLAYLYGAYEKRKRVVG